MIIKKEERDKELIAILTSLWYKSVQATYNFLTQEEIENFIPTVKQEIENIETLIIEYENNIPVGFLGLEKDKVEMLFIDKFFFRKGHGKKLIETAIKDFNIKYVDINENNLKALEFYKKMGFSKFDRAKVDDEKILKMRIK